LKGDASAALASLREMLSVDEKSVSLVHFNTVLAGLARAGHLEQFDAVWQEMRDRGIGPGDDYTFSSAAKCYMTCGQIEKALSVVRKAKEANVTPSVVLYGALLAGFAQRNDLKV
jgi:pentatricopeptide repeat protein